MLKASSKIDIALCSWALRHEFLLFGSALFLSWRFVFGYPSPPSFIFQIWIDFWPAVLGFRIVNSTTSHYASREVATRSRVNPKCQSCWCHPFPSRDDNPQELKGTDHAQKTRAQCLPNPLKLWANSRAIQGSCRPGLLLIRLNGNSKSKRSGKRKE